MSESELAPMPDYSDEREEPSEDKLATLRRLVGEMAALSLEAIELDEKLTETKKKLKVYEENLVPELMSEIDLDILKTKSGMYVELKEEVRASFPKDPDKREKAFEYLAKTGNDGLIKQEVNLSFGRDTAEFADRLMVILEAIGIGEHAEVERKKDINHQSMLKFIRTELAAGTAIDLKLFGAFVQKFAKIKMK